MDIQLNKKIMQRIIFFIIIIFFVSCNNFVDKLNSGLQKECGKLPVNDSCIVNLNKILGFDWDILYTFPCYSNEDSISKVIGLKYNGSEVKENETLYIFVKNNEVVYQATSKYFNDNVLFEFGFPSWPKQVNKFTTTAFRVYILSRDQKNKKSFYRLYPYYGKAH